MNWPFTDCKAHVMIVKVLYNDKKIYIMINNCKHPHFSQPLTQVQEGWRQQQNHIQQHIICCRVWIGPSASWRTQTHHADKNR